jgi:hypothetical protein
MASRSDNENGHAPRPGPYRALSLSQHDLRRVAVAACSDPRSVVAYLRGAPVRSTTRARVEAALESCGLDRLLRSGSGNGETKRTAE